MSDVPFMQVLVTENNYILTDKMRYAYVHDISSHFNYFTLLEKLVSEEANLIIIIKGYASWNSLL
jgi:hypothetical protein